MLAHHVTRSLLFALGLSAAVAAIAPASAADLPQNDVLNATLWMQKSVEYKANTIAVFTLAKMRLDQALADESWTAAPVEQTGKFQELPPAIIADLDETLLDNSAYQAWTIEHDTGFSSKTWTQFVKAEISTAIPGAMDFVKYAESKGVKVFYVTNRTAEEEPATRENMQKLGFPMGGNVDTVLTAKERPDWGSAKGTRRAYIAKDYRILLCLGDNFSDFTDDYRGDEAEREKVFVANTAHWGHDWIMLPNPSYGSFESAPFKHNYKLPAEERRKAKLDALKAWNGQ